MNIIDTNGISKIFNEDIRLSETYFVAPDVREEAEMTELIFDRPLPENILELTDGSLFCEAKYLENYRQMLDRHGDKSFFNMTGFGDISILASIRTILMIFEEQKITMLFDPTEQISVYTNDGGLKKKLLTEFDQSDVIVLSVDKLS